MILDDSGKAEIKVFLTGAGGSASANVFDSLRMSNVKYYVVGADVSNVRLHLSQTLSRCTIPLASSPGFVSSVTKAAMAYGIDVLHVQPDPEVRTVSRHRADIPLRHFLPSDNAILLASDKAEFAAAMAHSNVHVPQSTDFKTLEDCREKIDTLLAVHERVWVRARVGAGARASLPVSTTQQAVNWIEWWTSEKGMTIDQFMASEMLPGPEFAFQSVWQNGQLVVGQARERVEYLYGFLTPSGQSSTPSVARTTSDQSVNELAVRAIKALDSRPHGVYCVDIKTSADGKHCVTEINAGRFFTTSNFFAAAGVNMPDMAMRAAMGEDLPVIGLSPLSDDLYWIRNVDMGYVLVPADELDRWTKF